MLAVRSWLTWSPQLPAQEQQLQPQVEQDFVIDSSSSSKQASISPDFKHLASLVCITSGDRLVQASISPPSTTSECIDGHLPAPLERETTSFTSFPESASLLQLDNNELSLVNDLQSTEGHDVPREAPVSVSGASSDVRTSSLTSPDAAAVTPLLKAIEVQSEPPVSPAPADNKSSSLASPPCRSVTSSDALLSAAAPSAAAAEAEEYLAQATASSSMMTTAPTNPSMGGAKQHPSTLDPNNSVKSALTLSPPSSSFSLSSSPPSRSSSRNLSLSAATPARKAPLLLLRPNHSYRPRWSSLNSSSTWNFSSLATTLSGPTPIENSLATDPDGPPAIPWAGGPAPPVLLSVSVDGRWVNVASQKEDPIIHGMREALKEAAESVMVGLEDLSGLSEHEETNMGIPFGEASLPSPTSSEDPTLSPSSSISLLASSPADSPTFEKMHYNASTGAHAISAVMPSTVDDMMESTVDVSDALFNLDNMPSHLDSSDVKGYLGTLNGSSSSKVLSVEIPVELEMDEHSSSSSLDDGAASDDIHQGEGETATVKDCDEVMKHNEDLDPEVKAENIETSLPATDDFENVSDHEAAVDPPATVSEAAKVVAITGVPLGGPLFLPQLKVRSRPAPHILRRNVRTLLDKARPFFASPATTPADQTINPLSISVTTDSSIASVSLSPTSPPPTHPLTERDLAGVTTACGLPRHLSAAVFRRIKWLADKEREELEEAIEAPRPPSSSRSEYSISERASTLNAMAEAAELEEEIEQEGGARRRRRSVSEEAQPAVVSWDHFERFVRGTWAGCLDDMDALAFEVIRDPKRAAVVPEDFEILLADLLDNHPAFEFLAGSPAFQARFSETVIARLFYLNPRCGRKSMTLREFRKLGLVKMLKEVELATNSLGVTMPSVFSYKDFYVIYCKFWELDRDRDMRLQLADLEFYGRRALSRAALSRVVECHGRRDPVPPALLRTRIGMEGRPGEDESAEAYLGFKEFIPFILSVEDKTTDSALDYWFRVLDLDGDGSLSLLELETFWEHQQGRVPDQYRVEDFFSLILDLLRPSTVQPHPVSAHPLTLPECPQEATSTSARPTSSVVLTLMDLKRSRRASGLFLDMLLDSRRHTENIRRSTDGAFRMRDEVWGEVEGEAMGEVMMDVAVRRFKLEGWEKFSERSYRDLTAPPPTAVIATTTVSMSASATFAAVETTQSADAGVSFRSDLDDGQTAAAAAAAEAEAENVVVFSVDEGTGGGWREEGGNVGEEVEGFF
ncbi:Serine/threonine-protein phosphatase 2A regulatory subunit B'' subunit alpha [Dinochytrium kinnereticum]|nr:Serine/threonine-protein phosphatase 2A regulatory subunit B'' subunit alpha [Dinochytrium kinnereticum]